MSGVVFMSPDLAEFIVSPELDRKPLIFYTEDFTIGNFVHSSPLPINQVIISSKHVLWAEHHGDHQLEDPNNDDASTAGNNDESIAKFKTDIKSFRFLADEFYRRIPWRWAPDILAKWNLP
jgi:hypothetical protein